MQLTLGCLKMDHVDTLLQLFDTNSMIRYRDQTGSVPLHYACQNDAPFEVVRLLLYLDEIAPVRCRDRNGALPIHKLLKANPYSRTVKLLLEAYPDCVSIPTAS